jgi:type II secretory pathway pseudopilin PulG
MSFGLFSKKTLGFSLAEMAIIIAVASALAVSTLAWVKPTATDTTDKQKITLQRMDAIQDALKFFIQRKGRLPCPANPSYPSTGTTAYGFPTGGSTLQGYYADENLKHSVSADPVCSFAILTGGTVSQAGAVPTRTLGLPAEYMLDGWGRKFRYHVASNLCGAACTARTFANPATSGAYVLISYGEKAYDTYDIDGNHVVDSAANAEEANNIDVDSTYKKTYINTVTSTHNPNRIGHIVRYKSYDELTTGAVVSDLSLLFTSSDCTNVSSMIGALTGPKFAISTAAGTPTTSLNPSNFWNFTPLVSAYAAGNIDNYRGGEIVMDILWNLQEICYKYYGSSVITRQCPNNASAYYHDDGFLVCRCGNALWNGGC